MSPSSYVDLEDIENAKALLESDGFNVYLHPQYKKKHNQSAGTHHEKVQALHELVANPEIDAIFAAGGGNRSLHLLDKIDYDLIRSHPKIFMGFSDVTSLLNAIHTQTNLITFHGPVMSRIHKLKHMYKDNMNILSGKDMSYDFSQSETLREGQASGAIIGGNLSLFHLLINTPYCPNLDGKILILEDVNEELSKIDRMFSYMRLSGVFDKIQGLVCGGFSNLKDTSRPFGFSFEDIILENTQKSSFPIILNAPFGHEEELCILPIGCQATLTASNKLCELELTQKPVKV
jgi:muramoyltetrapeptide carboxypeptidase